MVLRTGNETAKGTDMTTGPKREANEHGSGQGPITLTLPGADVNMMQEAYKTLRTNIQFSGKDLQVIGLTSYGEGEGKTTITLNIAKSFAELGRRTLVLDADMRRSVLARRDTDAVNVKGLSEVLTGSATLDDCLYQTQYEGLDLLFAGRYPPNPVELLNDRFLTPVLRSLRERYDQIFIDTPPLGSVVDAAVVAMQCDGMIWVIGNSRVGHSQVRGAVEQLRRSGSRLLGVVRNQVIKHGKR